MKHQSELSQAVIDIHNISRLIESSMGSGQLSADLRKCADRLHILISPVKLEQNEGIE